VTDHSAEVLRRHGVVGEIENGEQLLADAPDDAVANALREKILNFGSCF
jgi:hypothetical protein